MTLALPRFAKTTWRNCPRCFWVSARGSAPAKGMLPRGKSSSFTSAASTVRWPGASLTFLWNFFAGSSPLALAARSTQSSPRTHAPQQAAVAFFVAKRLLRSDCPNAQNAILLSQYLTSDPPLSPEHKVDINFDPSMVTKHICQQVVFRNFALGGGGECLKLDMRRVVRS